MKNIRLLLVMVGWLCAAGAVHGQIGVDLEIKRRNFIRYEPVLATVTLSNLSGRDLRLEDGDIQWFGFQISQGAADTALSPRNPDYRLDPLELKAGETVKRTVNLNALYSLGELGHYNVRARIYSAAYGKTFSSKPDTVEISEGRTIWRQSIGVPDGLPNAGSTHTVSLLTTQSSDRQMVYIRVEDTEAALVFCTYQLGPKVEGYDPQVQLDASNNIYVLQLAGPKLYALSKVSVNGEFLGRSNYTSVRGNPYLRRTPEGELQIVGAKKEVPADPNKPAPKLSDRPEGLPKK